MPFLHLVPVRIFAVSLIGITLGVMAGCNRDNRPLVRVSSQNGTFVWDARMDDLNRDEDWDFVFFDREAGVEFESYDLSGTVEVEIFDDDGKLVFHDVFRSHGGREIEFDKSDPGESGEWTVRITVVGGHGHGVLRIEPRWDR